MRTYTGLVAVTSLLATTLFFAGCTKKDDASTQPQAQQPAASEAAPAGQPPAQASPGNPPAERASTSGGRRARQQADGSGQRSAPPSSGWGSTPGRTQASSPAPPRQFTLAAGTSVPVRTVTTLSTKTSAPGDRFEATLAQDLMVDDYVVAPRGSTVTGKVVDSTQGGKVKGLASISVALASIEGPSGPIAVQTQPIGQQAKSSKTKDAAKIGIGAGIGAAIGAIAGGGKGAAIGAGVGGAGGTGMVMMTKGEAATIPSETLLTFRLSAPVTVTEKR